MGKNKNNARREALRKRTERAMDNRSQGGTGFGVLDLGDHEKVKFFKPQKGNNLIDIIPFETSEDWYPNLRSPRGQPIGVKPGELDYKLELPVHRNIGPEEKTILCHLLAFGKPCSICEERKASGDDKIQEALKPKWRTIYNVIDLNNEDEGIQIFDVSEWLFEKELLEEAEQEEEVIAFGDLEEGMSIKFRAQPKKGGGFTFMEFKSFSFMDRDEALDESILEDVYSLDQMLKMIDYEEIQSIFLGIDSDDDSSDSNDNDEPKEEEQEPEDKPKRKRTRKSKVEETNSDKPECPADDNEFGENCAEKDECEECELFDACSKRMDELEAEAEAAKKEEKPKRKRTRKS